MSKWKSEGKPWQHIIGRKGEQLAGEYFRDNGYDILHTNWRTGHLEIDILAARGQCLHIIEVKTQSAGTAGYPEEQVNRRKLINLMKAADAYQQEDRRWRQLQFDVLAITLGKDGVEFFLIEDVYL